MVAFATSVPQRWSLGTSDVADFDLRRCNSPRSYWRFQRNTWLAFTPLANAAPATLAAWLQRQLDDPQLLFHPAKHPPPGPRRCSPIHALYRGLPIIHCPDGEIGRLHFSPAIDHYSPAIRQQ